MKEKVKAFGGTLAHSVRSKETMCVIATKDAMEKKPSKLIEAAEKKQIQVCSPEILTNVGVEGLLSNVKAHTISSWGSDPKARLQGNFWLQAATSAHNFFSSGCLSVLKI